MSVVSMRQLLEAGMHFGHQTRRWNPKMRPYIFTERNGIHILDLRQTLTIIEEAYELVKNITADGGEVLFVGTKKQAQGAIEEAATDSGMPYVNNRWLVEDGALDPVHRIGLELVTAFRLELVDCVDQPERPIRHEVRRFHVAGKTRSESPGDKLHQRGVMEDQALAGAFVPALFEFLPQRGEFALAALMHGGDCAHRSS